MKNIIKVSDKLACFKSAINTIFSGIFLGNVIHTLSFAPEIPLSFSLKQYSYIFFHFFCGIFLQFCPLNVVSFSSIENFILIKLYSYKAIFLHYFIIINLYFKKEMMLCT